MKSYLAKHGRSGIELIEEAAALIRHASPRSIAYYLVGTAPFVVGLLFFWSDMSQSPFAHEHLLDTSLILALLFIWMKGCQAIFARLLIADWAGQPAKVTIPGFARSLLAQAIIQPSALFVLPIAALITLPLPWAYAFYQNATALDNGERDLRTLFRHARQQAALWPKQNFVFLSLLSLFVLWVFVNWLNLCVAVPELLKTFFGIDSIAAQNPGSLMTTTLLAVVVGLSYLCVDPILKAAYALRCFYGSSLETGDDLRTELSFLRRPAAVAALVLTLFLTLVPSQAATNSVPPPAPAATQPATVPSQDLNRSIEDVLKDRKYTWRQPQADTLTPLKKSYLGSFFEQLGKWSGKVFGWIMKMLRKLLHLFDRKEEAPEKKSEGLGWIPSELTLLFVALAIVACALAIVTMRVLKARRHGEEASTGIETAPMPNIHDDYVGADQLPEDRWTALGRDLMAQGDLRAALRAFYLATLSHLANSHLLTISRGKSNRDYEKELKRRGHALPELVPIFSENVRVFDRVWYGLHEVNPEMVETYLNNLGRIKGIA